VQDITKEELLEIVRKIIKVDIPNFRGNNEKSFKNDFYYYLDEYYCKLLKHNFKIYKPEYFNRQKNDEGRFFEYTAEEVAEMIWG
jgi:hypothetical protein